MRILVLSLLALVTLSACGCGKAKLKLAVVQGKVEYKNRAVPNGTIMFIPAQGPAAVGELQPDGTYSLTTYTKGDGAVLGTHKVTLMALQDQGGKLPEERSPTPALIVPTKYTAVTTSDLKATVEEGKVNTINFTLTDN